DYVEASPPDSELVSSEDYSSQPSSFPFSHQDYVSQTQLGGSSSQLHHPKWQEIAISTFNTGSEGSSKRHKSTGSGSLNTKSGEASINLNYNGGDNDEDNVQEIRRPEGRDKAKDAGKKKGSKS
nr:hypothetical protein [Tanacetum cinerariifolium]